MVGKDFATPTVHRQGIVEMSCSTDCLRRIAVVDNMLDKDGVMIVLLVLNMGAVSLITNYCFFLPIFLLDEHRKLCQRPQIYYPPPAIEDREYNQTTWRERPEQNTKLVGTPVDECMLRPTICGQGKCVDLAEGYDCVCDAGFRKGKSQVCEG